ncbi:MAG: sulfate ABC transporter substrate-binding protein [Acidipropionibacterium sp.]|nr:sulfate ABC transporter substrate-binding protein [Acidipropionibacterium sp.]
MAYSTPAEANKAIIAAWQKTGNGTGVTFQTSYGASGDQSRSVANGQKADYVHFSLTPDVTRLVEKGLVASDWDSGPHKGIISTTTVAIAVRPGNPLGIKGWDDLIKPGVKIVTPNPSSSGSARWNILAVWGHGRYLPGGSEQKADDFLLKVLKNTVALPGSGRDATTAFNGGTGDVLLSYENEAIFARQKNESSLGYVVPSDTLLIENPGAVTKQGGEKAKQWGEYVLTEPAQQIYAQFGFRPLTGTAPAGIKGVNTPSDPFPAIDHLFTIDKEFGGWTGSEQEILRRRRPRDQTPCSGGQVMTVVAEPRAARPSGEGDEPEPRPASPRRGRRVVAAGRGLTAGSRLGLGVAVLWFSIWCSFRWPW